MLVLANTLRIWLLIWPSFQTPFSGIFIVTGQGRKVECEHELRMAANKAKICTSNKPIIAIDEISRITAIQYDPVKKVHYIDIGISGSGMQILTKTTNSLPGVRYALVVDDAVICLFSGTSDYAINYIRVGEDASLKELEAIDEALNAIRN
jgi:hypothetical protein